MESRKAQTLTFSAALLVVVLAGCQTPPTRTAAKPAPPSREPISQIVVLWSEAVLRQDNVPIQQGFAGKVYLFGADSVQPVTAPGKFTIYAYDDTNQSTRNVVDPSVKPTRTWELDESQLRHLVKKDAVGWSYSLWLPLGLPEATHRNYSLIVTFTPEGGRPVFGDSSVVNLPPIGGPAKLTSTKTDSTKSATKGHNQGVVLAGNVALD